MSLALLIGDRHSGKTSTCRQLAELTRACGLTVGGIIAPAVHREGSCVGYDVVDLATHRSTLLATVDRPGVEQAGRFHFRAEGLALGRAALEHAATLADALVIVDEVGPLELAGGGWADRLTGLRERSGLTLLTVRRSLATEVATVWQVPNNAMFDLADGRDTVIAAILARATALEQ